MGNKLGSVVKKVALVCMLFGCILGYCIALLFAITFKMGGWGVLIGIAAAIVLVIAEIPLYIFGYIVGNLEEQTNILRNMEKHFIIQKNSESMNGERSEVNKPVIPKKKIVLPPYNPEYVDVVCPFCKETLSFDKNDLDKDEKKTCPYCSRKIEISFNE